MGSKFVEKALRLASTAATEQLLEFILEQARTITRSDAAGIFILESSRPEQATAGVMASPAEIGDRYARVKLQAAAVTNWRLPAKSGLREYPAFPGEFPLFPDCRSTISAPLREANLILGWLIVECSLPSHYSARDIEALKEIARNSVPAIYRSLLRSRMADAGHPLDLVGCSPDLLEVERQARIAAMAPNGTVLITGERGSGKELVAEAVHFLSDRYRGPFLPVLASSFSEGLFTDELFGHERFAFTGANHERQGKFKAADGGTIFLDEVGDLDLEVQAGLLRVLERGELPRIGRDTPLRVNVRVVAATNRDLDELMAQGKFRRDLHDRLSVFEIRVPPLRMRHQDIVPLATHFLRAHCLEMDRTCPFSDCSGCDQADRVCCATPELYELLLAYNWPGNVRELAHVMLRVMATHPAQVLEACHLPERIHKHRMASSPVPASSENPGTDAMELNRVIERHLNLVIEFTKGNKTQAAKLLGLPRSTFNAMLRRYRF